MPFCPAGIHTIANGNNHIQIIEGNRLLYPINAHFLRVVLSVQFSLIKHIVDMFSDGRFAFIKQDSHLIGGYPNGFVLNKCTDRNIFFGRLVNQKLKIATHTPTSISAMIFAIFSRRTCSRATISSISAFSFTMSIFSLVSSAST